MALVHIVDEDDIRLLLRLQVSEGHEVVESRRGAPAIAERRMEHTRSRRS